WGLSPVYKYRWTRRVQISRDSTSWEESCSYTMGGAMKPLLLSFCRCKVRMSCLCKVAREPVGYRSIREGTWGVRIARAKRAVLNEARKVAWLEASRLTQRKHRLLTQPLNPFRRLHHLHNLVRVSWC